MSLSDALAALVPLGFDSHYRPAEDVLLLRTKAENAGHDMFHWGYLVGLPQVAIRWSHSRDVWVLEPLWVRLLPCITSSPIHSLVAVLYR